ncbi:hypothetical protein [Marinobacter sp.]
MTVRLGPLFAELCHWAVNEQIEEALEVSYHILGLDRTIMGIPNLVKELSFAESREILESWSDSPFSTDLLKFSEAFNRSAEIQQSHQPLGHRGRAKQTKAKFPDVSKRTFLLTLVTNPLAKHPHTEISKLRRSLRVWLILHAADRVVRLGCPADSNISNAARYLTIDSDDPHWDLIDPFLQQIQLRLRGKEHTFQRFNNALKNSAKQAYEQRAGKGVEYSKFLNSIQAIASGLCDPISHGTRTPLVFTHLNKHRLANSAVSESFALGDTTYNVVPNLDDEAPEDSPDFLLADIDPTDTPAQQTLLSGSVLIQTAEQSHYLPWSWDRLLPPEAIALDKWVSNSLNSATLESRLGGVYVWLAMTLSRSLSLLERVSVGLEDAQEWSISADFRLLIRTAPRRHSGWTPDENSRMSVAPIEEKLSLGAPKLISSILAEAAATLPTPPSSLGEIWRGNINIPPERWFNKRMTGDLERVTSAKLATRKAQTIFDSTADHRLARLLTSHPQSALPGACSYSSWDFTEIENGLELSVHGRESIPTNLNVIGSRLVPFEEVLIAEIARANEKLRHAPSKGLIKYHNALTQYVVMALYAATGARPLKDPFETAKHFSLDLGYVYIDDKNDGGLHSGRLIPLPDRVTALLHSYLTHLNALAQQVTPHRSTLGTNIRSLANGLSAHMPLFFLLDPALKWHSMGDIALLEEPLFDWPLPANLFRHRYAQSLSSWGVEPEVIEGWMGHAERSVSTYHDYSPRCWATDVSKYRSAINEVFECLGFEGTIESNPTLVLSEATDSEYDEPKSFGAKARAHQRKRRLQQAIRTAKDDIALFLGDQTIDDLDDTGLIELSRQMLLRTNQLPHPQAAVRYRLLAKLVARSSISPNRAFRKRMVSLGEERSLLSPKVIQALTYMPLLKEWAENARVSAQKSALSKSKALIVGAALLAIEKRLSYTRLLLDAANGKNFRVIQNDKHLYFEYNENLNADDFRAPVQRHEISYKTASLLAYGLERTQHTSPPSPTQIAELRSLVCCYQKDSSHTSSPTTEDLFTWLSQTIDQCNLIQLPGMVAAILSKRLPPTSSTWADHSRLILNRRVQRPERTSTKNTTASPIEALKRLRPPEPDKLTLQNNAKQFVSRIRDFLSQYKDTRSSATDTAKRIEKYCTDNRSSVSTSLMLLGYWLASLTKTGKAPAGRKFKPYALNSLTTYWSSMSSGFEQLTYQTDLIALDEDGVTDLCEKMLVYKRQLSTNTAFFGARLTDFFRWARQFGVESPDWRELDIDEAGRTVHPGLISEDDYLDTLSRIGTDPELDARQRLMMGFVLLCAYRFGLRAQEAITLLRKDICLSPEMTWVLVRNSSYGSLKSTASRRAVPLLFELKSQENQLIEEVIARYHSLCGNETNRPLLCETDDNLKTRLTCLASQLSASLIIAIRASTANKDVVLHHCRHSFYNRVAAVLLGLETPLAKALSTGINTAQMRHQILGRNTNCSRRIGMALARLMGHRSPRTGLLNYFHLQTEWSDQLTPIIHQKFRTISNVSNVSSWPVAENTAPLTPAQEFAYPKPTLATLFQTLRLVALGQSYVRAGAALKLAPSWIVALENTFNRANATQSFKFDTGKACWFSGKDCPNALLESIIPDAWQRMIHHAEKLDKASLVDCTEKNQVPLQDLAQLVSTRRHLVFDQQNEISLVRHVLNLFDIPAEHYQVYARFDDDEMIESLLEAGFAVESQTYVVPDPKKRDRLVKKKVALNGYPIHSRRNTKYSHGELLLRRSAEGTIRNSFDLAIALILTGLFISLTVREPSDPPLS